jgi:hypothetical protein
VTNAADASSDDVPNDPAKSPFFLQHGRHVRVRDDIGQRSAQRGTARRPEVGEKGIELLFGLPDVGRELTDVATGVALSIRARSSILRDVHGTIGTPLGCSLIVMRRTRLIAVNR